MLKGLLKEWINIMEQKFNVLTVCVLLLSVNRVTK